MLAEIGVWILFGVCQIVVAAFAAFLLLFAIGGLYATLREVFAGQPGILLISFWFAAGLCGIYKAVLANWNLFSYAVVAIAAIAFFYFRMKDETEVARNITPRVRDRVRRREAGLSDNVEQG